MPVSAPERDHRRLARQRDRRAQPAPTDVRSPGHRAQAGKRVSAVEVWVECPHRRSAWAKPNHTCQGAESENQPQAKKGPLTRVVASGRPSDDGARGVFVPHLREVCPPARHAFVFTVTPPAQAHLPARSRVPANDTTPRPTPQRTFPTRPGGLPCSSLSGTGSEQGFSGDECVRTDRSHALHLSGSVLVEAAAALLAEQARVDHPQQQRGR
jgi:hypothetical protein